MGIRILCKVCPRNLRLWQQASMFFHPNAGIAIGIALSGIGYSAFISFDLPSDMADASVLGLFLFVNVLVRKIEVH
ncbi:hypothetical protein [Desulfosporosinus shakirovi]|uniref:hypothetical protein n=1 Tax=Desulfosporosinus shakirovi TaxID=2885154 RepID=UPI001E52598A|nr:hypothetical protein [Desulfosporosinus sp. SRJS8]MCB8815636.1 hypothetical protein [Desulfosporosinus sp. SRJS8]